MIKHSLLLLALLTLSACSSLPSSPENTQQHPLLAQADSAVAKGSNSQAIALLERAVRLQPRNAQAWAKLAERHLAQGDFTKAEQFAGRAQLLAPNDTRLQRRCNKVIEDARRGQRGRG